eukprot:TRINITY_DN13590_c0_g1_i1.p1 TRINITY_DN13590_c0_g1~~TRINITY_DN13590_c0_g1_i1.p1  ORF type:complete len:594 (-),score=99.59 TRINITY_DN13590_c0_g1_i1:69-1802(-)
MGGLIMNKKNLVFLYGFLVFLSCLFVFSKLSEVQRSPLSQQLVSQLHSFSIPHSPWSSRLNVLILSDIEDIYIKFTQSHISLKLNTLRGESLPHHSKFEVKVTKNLNYSHIDFNTKSDKEIEDLWKKEFHCAEGEYFIFIVPSELKENDLESKCSATIGLQKYITFRIDSSSQHGITILERVAPTIENLFTNQLVSDGSKLWKHIRSHSIGQSNEYRLSFSLLNGLGISYFWDFPGIFDKHLEPFLEKILPVVNITVDSEIRHNVLLHTHPMSTADDREWIEGEDYFYLDQQRHNLQNLLPPTVDVVATSEFGLHFSIYVVPPVFTPLVLYPLVSPINETNVFGYTLPGRGGVILFNPHTLGTKLNKTTGLEAVKLSKSQEQEIFRMIGSQLRDLLGIPHPLDLQEKHEQTKTIKKMNPQKQELDMCQVVYRTERNEKEGWVADWELEEWQRWRSSEKIVKSGEALKGLWRIIQTFGSFNFPERIREGFETAVLQLISWKIMAQTPQIGNASLIASNAMRLAVGSFQDEALQQQEFIPFEFVIAIYAPVFLPFSVSFLTKIFSRARHLFRKWRSHPT